ALRGSAITPEAHPTLGGSRGIGHAADLRQDVCCQWHRSKRMAMTLQGKTAVVTGSTSGIGLGIAQALAKDGANIVMNGLGTETDNANALAAVKEHGTRVAFDGANMLRHNQIAAMIAKAEKTFGAVDILVNNAGI